MDPQPDAAARRILHCDMDAFYAAVHARDDASLRGRPLIVGGSPERRGVVAAASYEARAFGIRSAMPSARALELCPQALFVTPDFPRYRRESAAIFEIYRRFTDTIQTVSLDEAYLDVSAVWPRWGGATAIARAIREAVLSERGLTVSVGVGPSRLVAKIASDFRKPDGLTVVRPEQVVRFLDPLPARRLPGVGPATERRLAELGVQTVRQLRARRREELERRFGRNGVRLWRFANGIDERPVHVHPERKSLSSERTFERDLREPADLRQQLGRLAADVAAGLGKRELSACTVTLKVRYADFTTVTRSETLPGPVQDEAALVACGERLLERTEAGRRAVRLLGLGASNLLDGAPVQYELFGG